MGRVRVRVHERAGTQASRTVLEVANVRQNMIHLGPLTVKLAEVDILLHV